MNYLEIKYTLDFIFSLACLILLSPLLILIACLIRIEGQGPILYTQERVGRDQKIFRIYKFRTMVDNADQIGPLLTQDKDPRITKLGHYLRQSSLDELPQLLMLNLPNAVRFWKSPRAYPVFMCAATKPNSA